MARAQKLEIRKGATWKYVVRWETRPTVFKAISSASATAPCRLFVSEHNLPDGWRVNRISGVTGMRSLNTHALSGGTYKRTSFGSQFPNGIRIKAIDAGLIDLVDVNASGFGVYTGGGVVEYNTPVNMTGYSGRAHMRSSVKSETILLDFSEANGRLTLDHDAHSVTLVLSAIDTAALDFSSAVMSLEMTSSDGEVTLLLSNSPVLVRETDITR